MHPLSVHRPTPRPERKLRGLLYSGSALCGLAFAGLTSTAQAQNVLPTQTIDCVREEGVNK